jgi:hypothetical protein
MFHSRESSGIFVELIDNENNITNRYMYVARQLLELPARRDQTKQSGVYFTTAVHDKDGDTNMDPKFYSFEDAEEALGLFKTKEEAMTGGNPEFIAKTKYAEQEAALRDAQRELEKVKNDHKIAEQHRLEKMAALKHDLEEKQLYMKEKINDLEHNLEKTKKRNSELKEESDSRKLTRADYYEERSYERKDSSELIKFVPALIVGAIGMFALFAKGK